MTQETLTKTTPSQIQLSFNMRNIDDLFPGFMLGDFAMLHGLPSVLPFSLLLAIRAQLPHQLGGLESSALFVDGGNTFQLYDASRLARLHGLRPRDALQRIFISRAFTAHQMTSTVLDKIEEVATRHDAKLVIISDFAGLYLDNDIPPEESSEVFSQVTAYLAKFAHDNETIVLAACPQHDYSRRSVLLQAIACARSNVNIFVSRKSSYPFGNLFSLEKHPVFESGRVDFPSENLTLNDFIEATR